MRVMRPHFAALFIAMLGSAGCSDGPSEPAFEGFRALVNVQVAVTEEGVQLTNSMSRPIAYAVWNSTWLALFGPCTWTGPDCPRLAPGETVTVPIEEIGGWTPDATEAIVRWWFVEPDGQGGMRASAVREITVAL